MTPSTSQIRRIGRTNDRVKLCHVEVWFLDLDAPSRAAAFHAERNRRRFAECRAHLRRILASRTSLDPATIRFRYGSHGRPDLADNPLDLRFSVSHSSEHAVIAVTRERDLGIDIEVSRRIDHLDSLAERYLAPVEIEQLALEDDKVHAFWKAWTRKEAYVKALGTGLSGRICEFAVSLSEPARLLTTGTPGEAAADWTLLDLSHSFMVCACSEGASCVC